MADYLVRATGGTMVIIQKRDFEADVNSTCLLGKGEIRHFTEEDTQIVHNT